MFTSNRRTEANRENAKKSTGPITPEGKAKSCLNRLSHGFASNTRLLAGEDPEEFYGLLNDLIQEYNPASPTQQILVEDMAQNRWLSLRAFRIQGDLMANRLDFISIPRDLALLIRYQNTAIRAFHKSHDALVKAQKEREKSANGFESQKAAAAPQKAAQKPPAAPPATPEIVIQPEIAPLHPEMTPELIREMAAAGEKSSQAA